MAAAAALMLGGCASLIPQSLLMPSEYLGISTETPITQEERTLIALLGRRISTWGDQSALCPWPDDQGGITRRVSCDVLPLSYLARLAFTGDKPAALELGIRFEAGRGVPQDFDKALQLYKSAGTTTGGPISIYIPGFDGRPGMVESIDQPYEHGLPEAYRRRGLLEAWREKQANPDAPPCPAPPIALDSLAAQPETAPERARLEAALASGKLGRGQCDWMGDAARLTTIPCDVLPVSRLARLADGGDRTAMLELGKRFERGREVAANPAQAGALYCAAGETRITKGGFEQGPNGGWTPLSGELGLPEARRGWERVRKAEAEAEAARRSK
jgi:TPR repeat protein